MSFVARNFLFLGLFLFSFPLLAEPTLWDFLYRQWAETMLLRAASKGNLGDVKYYLSKGCNINTRSYPFLDGYTPLAYAAIYDMHEVVKYLLQQKAYTDTCKEGCTLKIAVQHKTIHTPFTVLLWNKPYEEDKEAALGVVNKLSDGYRKENLKSMIVDFEKYVNENKHALPSELIDQVDEYVQKTPSLAYTFDTSIYGKSAPGTQDAR